MMHKERYSITEAAEYLGCSRKHIVREIRSGKIAPVLRVNARVVWIRRAALLAYEAQKIGPNFPNLP